MPKVVVNYDNDVFEVEVETRFDHSIDFEHILAAMAQQIDSDIAADTHNFQIFDPVTHKYKAVEEFPRICGTRFVATDSVIRVSAKPSEAFKCTVEFFHHTDTKYCYDVVVDNCTDESAKYQKLMDKFWDMCGKNFPINYTFEIFDEKTKDYKKLNKRKPNIPNGSLIRIRPSDEVKVTAVTPVPEPHPKPFQTQSYYDYKPCPPTSDSDLILWKAEQKKGFDSKQFIGEKKRRANPTLSDWITKELSGLGIDDKSTDSSELKDSDNDSPQLFFDSLQDKNDYYLCLSITNCLKTYRKTAIEEPLAFFGLVAKMLDNEYDQKTISADACRQSFEELFSRYLEVLRSATNLVDTQNRLKCFDLFDSIDFGLFLLPNVYSTVDYLRNKLWYGIVPELNPVYRHRSYSQPIAGPLFHPLVYDYPFAGYPLYYHNQSHQNCCQSTSCNSSDVKLKTKLKKSSDSKHRSKDHKKVKDNQTVNRDNVHSQTDGLTIQELVSLAKRI